jgi:hypothetical protein
VSIARDIIDRVFFPNRDVHAIPVLDGGFSPNRRLEDAEVRQRFEAPDALAFGPDGRLYVSAGADVHVCAGPRFEASEVFAHLPGSVGALAWNGERLLVAVDGHGIVVLASDGRQAASLEHVDGAPLHCVTALAAAADGTVYATDGSRANRAGNWLLDLMQCRPGSGRLIACTADLAEPRVLLDGLDWPDGVAVSHDESEVLLTEAWRHRLSAVDRAGGARRVLIGNFAGYPGRIRRGGDGDYWIAFFALRTQLTEFVLREPAFRRKMMAEVPPELWIGPSLGGHFDYREPTQVGRIKKLGIQKPWAPARSYGLVGRFAGDRIVESLHSRVSGELHGVTDVAPAGDALFVVSRGHGKLAAAPLETARTA